MNFRIVLAIVFTQFLLSGCANQHIDSLENIPSREAESKHQSDPEDLNVNSNGQLNPPLTITKDHKQLNLVRIMDGGICKNEFQGASGSFLVYADLNDIERIKREKTNEVFNEFETKIQHFSSEVLEKAIQQTNLAIDPFSLGEDVMQQKLAEQLISNFRTAAASPLDAFKRETTLTIDVTPFSPSLVFYQKGCDMNHFDQTPNDQ